MLSKRQFKSLDRLITVQSAAANSHLVIDSPLPSLDSRRESHSFASSSGQSHGKDILYPTHTPIGPFQRGAIAIASAFGAALNPYRGDLVAALGETTGVLAFRKMQKTMQNSSSGRKILEDRPRITNAVLSRCVDMPEGTFGRAYGDFMGRRHFAADDRPPVRFIDDVDLAYVAQRARETHDLWHVIFSCPTTVAGELALKALEFVQTGLPMAALSVLGAQWRLKPEARSWLMNEAVPWAMKAGTRCPDLVCLPYEEHFQDNMEELRRRWRIIEAPPMPKQINVQIDS